MFLQQSRTIENKQHIQEQNSFDKTKMDFCRSQRYVKKRMNLLKNISNGNELQCKVPFLARATV